MHKPSDAASRLDIDVVCSGVEIASQGEILIVDTCAENCSFLCQTLKSHRYKVRFANSGEAALKALDSALPHIILLDIHAPVLNGYEVCQQIKADSKTQHIPILFISDSDKAFDRIRAFKIGGVDYITKPFQIEEILVRIRNQIELQLARKRLDELNNELEQRVVQRTLQLQAMHNRLRASEARLESILDTLQDIVWSASVQPFQILYLNPAAARIYQRPLEDFSRNSMLWFDIIHPDDRLEVVESMNTITIRGNIDIEYRVLLPEGGTCWVRNRSHIVVGESNSVSVRVEGIITDISDRKRAEKQLIHDALHDGLTQLPNRTLFVDRLETSLARQRRSPSYGFAVLFLDLDRFKVVNDSLGHAAGDQLLIEVADRLLNCVRAGDTVARLGGDEFTILLDEVTETSAVINCVKKIQAELNSPVEINGNTVHTGSSIGIVMATQAYKTGPDLLRDADIAMYRAKENHRAGYELFDQAMHAQTMRRMKLENDLHISLKRHEFELRYQPIIALKDEQVVGFEALVRWQNPDEGIVRPDEFIHIAEEIGLIVPLGNWIFESACRQLKQWQLIDPKYGNLKINVNIASQQLRDPHLIKTLDYVLNDIGLSGHCIRMEITESVLVEKTESTIEILNQIRQRGVHISIDDFGTGYSSLSYLSRLPINNLKIDKSFVSRMHLEVDSLEIVRTITTLAQTLDMDVTAEGIELDIQLYLLKELNCEFGQGYYFSKPMTATAVEALLVKRGAKRPAN
ncbi:EAL domain-containing protein [Oscillatoria sp. CS-180]|uniref:GGDEF/EAL domain-containing response regulator n=1 Tax=Oscillatoria sp. CS-180 TaxID=3021720 RepID=UPI00232F0E16|nr:EAL domain-containing protein [Oscillatoria sp. CS-180]MDB9525135.1 EAL domain-containing protein [Oscillatoria sp. CS-180]